MVRLLPPQSITFMVNLRSFNPTMVRLLRDIRARTAESMASFNPTMVRLLQAVLFIAPDSRVAVSIPQWCDCC